MGQRTQMLVLKTIHFKDGTKQHKNELYHFQWGFGRTMFMALMSALWKHSEPVISRFLKDADLINNPSHPFAYHTIDHPSSDIIDRDFDSGMIDMELSDQVIDVFLNSLANNDGYMVFYHDVYETDNLYAKQQYRLVMKQRLDENGVLVSLTPEEYMEQYSTYCTPDFIDAWTAFARYHEINTTI